jgi:hypothetical protein
MMRMMRRPLGAVLAAAAIVAAAFVATGTASPSDPANLTNVAAANTKTPGVSSPNVLSAGLTEVAVAQGSTPLENGTQQVPFYGYDGNGPLVPVFPSWTEAQKTEPDKNTYLVSSGLKGADPSYDYGSHFLFQGHEGGTPGYLTRINLDADGAHRVTLVATKDSSGADLPDFDGSTWDPWARRMLFTAEGSKGGGVWQATLDVPATVDSLTGILGQGGFEGIQNDSDGNLWIVEDSGGPNGATNAHAKQPNSFVYRFKPTNKADLTKGGTLQALQVISLRNGQPIVFHAGQADADIKSDDTKDLHTYGHSFQTRWVTIHDTATDGTAPFSANAAAKSHQATPFKRPENGLFQPGTGFGTFFFDETGDTDNRTEAGADYGGFGAVQKLSQDSPSADHGTLRLFYQSDQAHSGFDNVAFLARDKVAFVEDAGDTLHTQRNALDSGYVLDTDTDYSTGAKPVRFLAEGRDASATIDSGLSGSPGFTNDGDNEITGLHASDGDPTPRGVLGAKVPRLFSPKDSRSAQRWRLFYTAQHGDNVTWEILPARAGHAGD